jgi:hypothetical protein
LQIENYELHLVGSGCGWIRGGSRANNGLLMCDTGNDNRRKY